METVERTRGVGGPWRNLKLEEAHRGDANRRGRVECSGVNRNEVETKRGNAGNEETPGNGKTKQN